MAELLLAAEGETSPTTPTEPTEVVVDLDADAIREALCDPASLPDACVQLVNVEADWQLVLVAFAVIVAVSLAALVVSGMKR